MRHRRRPVPVHSTSAPPPGMSRTARGAATGHGAPSATGAPNAAVECDARSGHDALVEGPPGRRACGPGDHGAPVVIGGHHRRSRGGVGSQHGAGAERHPWSGLGQTHPRGGRLDPGHARAARARHGHVAERHAAARVDDLGGAERLAAWRPVQAQPVAGTQRNTLGAVDDRRGPVRADRGPRGITRLRRQPLRRPKPLARRAQRRPRRRSERRPPGQDSIAAFPDRGSNGGAARHALQRRHGPRRAERGGARVAHGRLESPAPVRPMPEPHDDRGAATPHRERREVHPAPPRHHARPADPSAGVEPGDAHPPPGRNPALKRDHAAAVRGHRRSHRPLRGARPQERSPRPERLARRRHAPLHGGRRLRHLERSPGVIDGEVHWHCGGEQKPERDAHAPTTRRRRVRRGLRPAPGAVVTCVQDAFDS